MMGELLRSEPIFPAKSELDCLRLQCELLGTPSCRIWPVRGARGGAPVPVPVPELGAAACACSVGSV